MAKVSIEKYREALRIGYQMFVATERERAHETEEYKDRKIERLERNIVELLGLLKKADSGINMLFGAMRGGLRMGVRPGEEGYDELMEREIT